MIEQETAPSTAAQRAIDIIAAQDVKLCWEQEFIELVAAGPEFVQADIKRQFDWAFKKKFEKGDWAKRCNQERAKRPRESQHKESDGLPNILISSRQLRDITTDGIDALKKANDPPFIFRRAGEICHVVKDEAGRPSVEQASAAWIRGSMSRTANWLSRNSFGELKGTFPPPEVVADIASIDNPPFPGLASVTEVPTLRADGTILHKRGYDPISSLYYEPAPDLKTFPLPDKPTQAQVKEARSLIEEAISDFPYADEASRANVFGLLLTPVLRPAIFGCTPLAVVDAPQAGTGKSLLIDVLSIITTGRPSAMVPYPYKEDEMQKQIAASLISGRQLIAFDNLEGELRSPALALALTAKEFEARILGFTKNFTVANMSTWVVTGNNIRPAGDMPRRCYQIRLNAKQSKPYTGREFKHPDLLRWCSDNRSELLHALLIIARYWYSIDCPDAIGKNVVGSFEDWHRKVGSIVACARIPGFLANYTDFIEQEDESPAQWEGFLAHVFEMWTSIYTPGATRSFTIADLIEAINAQESSLKDKLPAEISDRMERKDKSPRIAIGKLFQTRRERRFGYGADQFWIERVTKDSDHKGCAEWCVRKA